MKRKLKRFLWWGVLPAFLFINLIAFVHAWHFTHFKEMGHRTEKPEQLSTTQKLKVLLAGITVPKPLNASGRSDDVTEIVIQSRNGMKMKCWGAGPEGQEPLRGVVLLFHGYAGHKSTLLEEATAFREMGYYALLVDFLGHGDSEGNATSLGYGEAEDIGAAIDWSHATFGAHYPVVLYGVSMGAVAILKNLADKPGKANAAIIEAPFASMRKTVANRFEIMGVPAFPLADLLVFWGGIQHGFWAFGHNGLDYAAEVEEPVLMMLGAEDQRAKVQDGKQIFEGLPEPKHLVIFEGLAHQSFLRAEPGRWKEEVEAFLNQQSKR